MTDNIRTRKGWLEAACAVSAESTRDERIAELEAENARLREGLRSFAEAYRRAGRTYHAYDYVAPADFARAAELVPEKWP